MSDWADYYAAHSGRPPRPLLIRALDLCGPGGRRWAIDVGAGQGTETTAMLARGWRVLAIDSEATAAALLRSSAGADADAQDRLEVATADVLVAPLRPAALIWSGQALPFVGQAKFAAVWSRLLSVLLPGGVLAVDVWGTRHAWSSRAATHTRDEVELLLDGLDVIEVEEQEEQRQTVADGPQHWHAYAILARRPH